MKGKKVFKRVLAVVICVTMILGCAPFSLTAFAADDLEVINPKSDPLTSSIENYFEGSADDDGMIKGDKSVQYGDDPYDAFSNYDSDEFSVTLSAMGQAYTVKTTTTTESEKNVHADVIFVVDVSGSMGRYTMSGSTLTREEGTAIALNSAINKLMEADPETRIGIVCYGSYYYGTNGLYLPIDKYTLPEGDTNYITCGTTSNYTTINVPDATVVAKGTALYESYTYIYFDGTEASQNNDTTKARLRVDSDGNVAYYPANSTTATTDTVDNNAYKVVTLGGTDYAILRTGNCYTIYNNLQYTTGNITTTVTHTKEMTNITTSTSSSSRTSVTLDNNVNFRAYRTSSSIYVYRGTNTTRRATLTSSSPTATYTYNNVTYTFTRTSASSMTISYDTTETTTGNVLKTTTKSVPVVSSGTAKRISTSGCLTNSAGQTMSITGYTVNNDGTFTQAGLKAAENMFATVTDTSDRIPVVVLVSDGTPTFYDTDYANVPLMNDTSTGGGDGTTTKGGNGNVANCTNQMGYLTIRTAMSVKSAVDHMYPDQRAMFYSIGPGVDYLFGQTVLDPSAENLASCNGNTTTNEQSGNGTPDGLRTMLLNNLSSEELAYVDFADWSMSGNMSTEELEEAFEQVVTNITDVPRPITITEIHTVDGNILSSDAYAVFTDTIGDGMQVNGSPVVRYNNNNYAPTGSTTTTLENGNKVVSYKYNYTVTESSTQLVRYLDGLIVYVVTDTDGKVTVYWYIPSGLLPIVYPNIGIDITYNLTTPIRLIYQVGLNDESKLKSGTYYTNSVDEPATFTFKATKGNPYYYENELDEYGVVLSSTFDYANESVAKTTNTTNTLSTSSMSVADPDENIISMLGNNGVLTLDFTQIQVTKVWDDDNDDENLRPESISFRVYRNGTQYGDLRTYTADDCVVTVDGQGRDIWIITIDGLPKNANYNYTVSEVSVPNYNTTEVKNADGTYTVTNKVISGNLSYQLYLVNEDGTPVTEDGTETTFENRTVKSDLITIKKYASTNVIDLNELEAILPKGYYIYNESASYTETFGGTTNNSATISDDTGTTKVFYPTTAVTGNNGTVNGITDYSDTKVAFAVVKINIVPDVVVLDYGKTIYTDPLANDTGVSGYKLDGILATSPVDGTKTVDTVKLNNGVVDVEKTNGGSVSATVPKGNIVVYPFVLNQSTYIFPSLSSTSTTNDTSVQRYYLNSNGTLTKYQAGSSSGTNLGVLALDNYIIDGNYMIYRSADNKVSVVTGYSFTETTTETEVPVEGEGYYVIDGTATLAENVTITGTSKYSATTVGTLPDGAVIKAAVSGSTIYVYDSSVTTYGALASSGNTSLTRTFNHTLAGYEDKNGNDIVITYTVSRNAVTDTAITVVYDTVKSVSGETETITTTERVLNVRTVAAKQDGVIYTPFKYMSSIDRVYYYVSPIGTGNNTDSADDDVFYSTITYIPATSVYYEDDFGGSAEDGGLYIQYTGDWYTVTDDGTQTAGVTANTDTDDRQDRGEVGTGKVPYGYDSSYDDCVDFSNGSASKVTGTVSLDPTTKRPKFDATAQFTFTGTGFDIISRTDLDCGMITVYVTDSTGKSVNMPVINKGTGTLYQIPVISFMCEDYFDEAYGTFTVKINVSAPSTALNITGSIFYLDAIRIYNPMGNSADDNAEFDEANDAYNADHEANEYVASIRDYILQAGKLDETEQYGAVYVDTVNNEYSGGGMLDDKDYEKEEAEETEETQENTKGSTEENTEEDTDVSGMETLNYRVLNQSMIKDFELIGPNEEVYLSPGYGVGFILETTKEPASVQLEMKIPAPIQTGASLSVYTFNKTTNIGKLEINSASEMFYDITDDVIFTETDGVYRAVVVLENGLPSTNAGEIVSITNLKLTYDDDVIAVNAADEDALFTLDSVDEENVALTSLKASWNTYEDVFDSVYIHRLACTPNYEVSDAETLDEVIPSGKIVTAKVNTSKYVEDLVIKTPKGNVVTPVSITSTLDESKLLTDEYKEAKTWTVKFPVYGTDGTVAEYTIESANGDGTATKVDFEIDNLKVAKIEVYNKPKTSYKVGESFDSTGMTLKVTYVDGTEKIIGTGYATESVTFTKSGKQNVNVSFGGKTTVVKVTVIQTFVQAVKSFFAALARFKFSK